MDQLSLADDVLTIQKAMGIVSMAVGLVFAYAAASKTLDLRGFVAGVRDYDVIPSRFAPLAARLLIVGESFIALAHFRGIALQLVVPATIGLLSIFFVTTGTLLKRGGKRPCMCFGGGSGDLDIYSLARIALLLCAEATLLLYLAINGGSISTDAGDMYGDSMSVATAALTVVLAGWCLALPGFYRVWDIVRS